MNEFKTSTSEIVVAVDIGTTKICAIAGRRNQYGKIEILGMGKVKSEGVNRGVVSNIDKTVKAISEAVSIAEKSANVKFKKVHVGIAGQHIKSIHHHGILMREEGLEEISNEDVEKLINDMYRLVLPPGDKILHVIPQEFTVDDEQDIQDPVGMSGVRLEANFHIITGQVTASRNILRCVEKVGLEVADITLEPIASAAAVLSKEEKEAGVALVDIGGGTTDITIFKDGIIRHTAVIPFGGGVITNDIKEGCTVMQEYAEKLKVRFGSALAEEIVDNRIITIAGFRGREPKEISEKNLSRIIQARVEEIFDYVLWEVRRSGFEGKLLGGIVITGGGSLLRNINLLSEYHTGMSTRIGIPTEHLAHKYDGMVDSPIYSTGVGLLITAIEQGKVTGHTEDLSSPKKEEPKQAEMAMADEEDFTLDEKQSGKWYENLFTYAKEFFEASPDSEF
ncbi:cell division protein FtsA [Portibacter lacus]|uniref:Cell division protein FtsA n=1 Tax=Portibacter lacus TaxID=1099794 RepID=A0AA37WDH5_9BACT|nr:cell division protein FtsA [Portibacter lacus]GLR15764.1 cell division protein FtsA [Portibacter lacus]